MPHFEGDTFFLGGGADGDDKINSGVRFTSKIQQLACVCGGRLIKQEKPKAGETHKNQQRKLLTCKNTTKLENGMLNVETESY